MKNFGWFQGSHAKNAMLLGTGLFCFTTVLLCSAQDCYLLNSQSLSRVEYYQNQGLKARVLVEDTWATFSSGAGRMIPAGSLILTEKDPDARKYISSDEVKIPDEIKKSLANEAELLSIEGLQTVSARPLPSERKVNQPLTFEKVQDGTLPSFGGRSLPPLYWMNPPRYGESEEYLQWDYCEALQDKTLCIIEARTGKVLGPLTVEREWKKLKSFPAFEKRDQPSLNPSQMDATYSATWLNQDNDLYYVKLDGSQARRLTFTPEPEELVLFSPDGRFISYVSGNNLWVVDVEEGAPRALTQDGSETIRNGKSSWVYYEEVYSRDWQAYWWSPDSRQLIFYRTDDAPVPTFTLIDEGGTDQRIINTRYPRAGEPNPRVTLATVSVSGGSPRWLNLHEYDPEDYIVARAGFTNENEPWYIIQDRAQKWLDFWVDEVKMYRDSTPAWIEPPLGPLFIYSQTWVTTSTCDGFKHLYLCTSRDPEGGGDPLMERHPSQQYDFFTYKQLTSGPWEIRDLLGVSKDWWIYFTATRDNLIGENLYRVNRSGQIERLTWEPGSHKVSLSPDYTLFIDTWSSRQSPGNSALRTTQGSAKVRMLNSNPVYAREEYQWGKSEQFSITLKDGYEMEVGWILPPHFDPQKKYPVWMQIYGGPEMPSIHDNWAGGRTLDQSLANEGVIVFYADPRVASGKGSKYAWPCYKHIFVHEGEDLAEAITWLGGLPFVDKTRIGLSGYSYGGSMTLWMMTRYDLFCAGIAGGAITDDRDYDSIYTERYMDTPQNNPEGYAVSSIISQANQLHGRLLIVHGQLDDNVHPANTWKFVKALQDAQIQFDQMVYPRTPHAYGGPHHYQLMRHFIRRELKLEANP